MTSGKFIFAHDLTLKTQENAAGLIKMLAAIVFPFGLVGRAPLIVTFSQADHSYVTVVLTGADLCTGSFMVSTVVSHRKSFS